MRLASGLSAGGGTCEKMVIFLLNNISMSVCNVLETEIIFYKRAYLGKLTQSTCLKQIDIL